MSHKPTISSFYYKIVLREKLGREPVEVLLWTDMRFEVRMKWDWYFKYRAALLRVRYPRHHIDEFHGAQNASARTEAQIVDAQIRSKKAKITEYTNKLKTAEEKWDSIFPITDDVFYKKAKSKIKSLEHELQELQIQHSQYK